MLLPLENLMSASPEMVLRQAVAHFRSESVDFERRFNRPRLAAALHITIATGCTRMTRGWR